MCLSTLLALRALRPVELETHQNSQSRPGDPGRARWSDLVTRDGALSVLRAAKDTSYLRFSLRRLWQHRAHRRHLSEPGPRPRPRGLLRSRRLLWTYGEDAARRERPLLGSVLSDVCVAPDRESPSGSYTPRHLSGAAHDTYHFRTLMLILWILRAASRCLYSHLARNP